MGIGLSLLVGFNRRPTVNAIVVSSSSYSLPVSQQLIATEWRSSSRMVARSNSVRAIFGKFGCRDCQSCFI